MDHCQACRVTGRLRPLFLRLIRIGSDLAHLKLCAVCQRKRNEVLRRQIRLGEAPYDTRSIGIGA